MVRLDISELKKTPQPGLLAGIFGQWTLPEPVRVWGTWCAQGVPRWVQHGVSFVSSYTWIFATAAVIIYLPLLRALDSDREMIRAIKVRSSSLFGHQISD